MSGFWEKNRQELPLPSVLLPVVYEKQNTRGLTRTRNLKKKELTKVIGLEKGCFMKKKIVD